jgi:hypothetical protein
MCIITGSKLGFKKVFCAYLREYCTDLGPIWHKYTLVSGGSSNRAGGHASLNVCIIINIYCYEMSVFGLLLMSGFIFAVMCVSLYGGDDDQLIQQVFMLGSLIKCAYMSQYNN